MPGKFLDVNVGDVIRDSALRKVFDNIFAVQKILNQSNVTIENGILIEDNDKSGREVNIYFDGKKIATTSGVIENGSYSIYINGLHARTIYFNENLPRENYTIYWGAHIITVEIGKPIKSNMRFATTEDGIFLNIISDKL
jgi:hypothetical protein